MFLDTLKNDFVASGKWAFVSVPGIKHDSGHTANIVKEWGAVVLGETVIRGDNESYPDTIFAIPEQQAEDFVRYNGRTETLDLPTMDYVAEFKPDTIIKLFEKEPSELVWVNSDLKL